MGITVKEAMKIGGLQKTHLVAGAVGLNREVEQVAVMEVPDVIQWLQGNEIVLTSGFAISKKRKQQILFIQQLAEVGVGALVIKNRCFEGGIPLPIIETADAVGLPVLELDTQVRYSDIIRPVMAAIINMELGNMKLNLAEIAVVGNNLLEKCGILHGLWGYPVAIVSNEAKILAEQPLKWFSNETAAAILAQCQKEGLQNTTQIAEFLVLPLNSSEGTVDGYLLMEVGDKTLSEQKKKNLDGILPYFTEGVFQQKEINNVSKRFQKEFFEDILLGRIKLPQVAERRARLIDLPECGAYVVANLYKGKGLPRTIDGYDWYDWPGVIYPVEGFLYTAVGLTDNNEAVFLLALEKHDAQCVNVAVGRLWEMLQGFGLEGAIFGVSDIFTNLMEASKAYKEAQNAWFLGSQYGEDDNDKKLYFFRDMGIYRLLSLIKDKDMLLQYVPPGLKELCEYDASMNTELVKTLRYYLANAGNARKTAKDLFVHYKTLQYRLERISKITRADLDCGERWLEYHLGLKILQMTTSHPTQQKY